MAHICSSCTQKTKGGWLLESNSLRSAWAAQQDAILRKIKLNKVDNICH
jgi:hypothetical protein